MSRSSDKSAADALFSQPPPLARRASARPVPAKTAAMVFRALIEKAEEAGAKRKNMTLRLTLRDSADLKRDRAVALDDIAFKDGVMSFLGVKVETGGVATSVLDAG